jgi:hypothetical protein
MGDLRDSVDAEPRRDESILNTLIDINDDGDLDKWARQFGITADELAKLVNELGPSSERIRESLKHRIRKASREE